MVKYRLKLFVMSRTGRARNAIDNLHEILGQVLVDRYELTIIDVLEEPQTAEAYKVVATPMLIKELPSPVRRIVGDFSDRRSVLAGLDLAPSSDAAGAGGTNED